MTVATVERIVMTYDKERVAIAARIATLKDAAQARERIYKSLLKRSWLLVANVHSVRCSTDNPARISSNPAWDFHQKLR